jgi:hypothetical protein
VSHVNLRYGLFVVNKTLASFVLLLGNLLLVVIADFPIPDLSRLQDQNILLVSFGQRLLGLVSDGCG